MFFKSKNSYYSNKTFFISVGWCSNVEFILYHVNVTLSDINIRCLKTSRARMSESNTIYIIRVYFSKPETLHTSINCTTFLEIRELLVGSTVREDFSGL